MPRFLKNCCRFARRVSSTPMSCADLLRRNARGGVAVLRVRRGLSAAIESSVMQPGFTALLVLIFWLIALANYSANSARMVDEADTFSPIATRGRLPTGKYTSTRDPKRIKP